MGEEITILDVYGGLMGLLAGTILMSAYLIFIIGQAERKIKILEKKIEDLNKTNL